MSIAISTLYLPRFWRTLYECIELQSEHPTPAGFQLGGTRGAEGEYRYHLWKWTWQASALDLAVFFPNLDRLATESVPPVQRLLSRIPYFA